MPKRNIPAVQATYHLLAVDSDGHEIPDPDVNGGRTTDEIIRLLKAAPVTDVFLWSHGWKGDVPAAYEQYDKWVGAFSGLPADRALMEKSRPGFKELHVGLHWPSLAWGDETPAVGDSFAPQLSFTVDTLVDQYAVPLGDTPAVREALGQLFAELRTNAAALELTPKARDAYFALDRALALGADGTPGEGAADRASFNPDQTVETAQDEVSFGSGASGSLLSPLRQLTFWTMKKRASKIGELFLHGFIARLMTENPYVRVHLMGHSFGCIVMSSALAGPHATSPLPRPVASCVLVQGAMSLWAYASKIPFEDGVAGYFSRVLADSKVSGPIVTTRSKHDYAVGKLYPWAAGVANQFAYDTLPQFGAIGAFGICGTPTESLLMRPATEAYDLKSSVIYNVDGSQFICKIDGVSGAHSDIAGPEVAHLIWQAALPV
ncbi:hypothetical protein [Variovorax sp. OV700]|uniref:hypothetical protein n=1 Tax=Variovorax sp. OV700 TaxID=1882826 RepID=UPI000881F708|nr:hypothetical protein [Variovorax sp. OV700]SDJ66628.1 hypothetical protein SAMN05444748_1182 [Variovorax sp. OV700]